MDLTEITKSTSTPADAIIIGMLSNFAIDLALTQTVGETEELYMSRLKARSILSPVFSIRPCDTAYQKVSELTTFVAESIAQL